MLLQSLVVLALCITSHAFSTGKRIGAMQNQLSSSLRPITSLESPVARDRAVLSLRGGAINLPAVMKASPTGLFNGLFLTLSGTAALFKLGK